MYSSKVFAFWTPFGFILVFSLTALLKLEITVYFLWLSLPVHSGSLKRIYYSKLYSLAHTLSFEWFHCSKWISLIFAFYLLLLQLVLCCVAALKAAPYIVHSTVYIFSFLEIDLLLPEKNVEVVLPYMGMEAILAM